MTRPQVQAGNIKLENNRPEDIRPENIRPENTRETQNSDQAIEAIRAALDRLRFGTIALTLHEGRVVQIEVTEKMRL